MLDLWGKSYILPCYDRKLAKKSVKLQNNGKITKKLAKLLQIVKITKKNVKLLNIGKEVRDYKKFL